MSISAPTLATASSTTGATFGSRSPRSVSCSEPRSRPVSSGSVWPATVAVRAASLSRVPPQPEQRTDVVNRATASRLPSDASSTSTKSRLNLVSTPSKSTCMDLRPTVRSVTFSSAP